MKNKLRRLYKGGKRKKEGKQMRDRVLLFDYLNV